MNAHPAANPDADNLAACRAIRSMAGVFLGEPCVRRRVVDALVSADGPTVAQVIVNARESFPFGSLEWAACTSLLMRCPTCPD